ncbi:MAG: EcsC family protein [Candidatus Lernaella stagnicola]|nr:EcsC family protein [Candidatus Lernaella stagnicola]
MTLTPATMPSAYEIDAWRRIREWKDEPPSRPSGFSRLVQRPFHRAGDAVLNLPWVGGLVERTFEGLVGVLSDAARYTVRPAAVWQRAGRKTGREVTAAEHLRALPLETIDALLRPLPRKYFSLAAVEGAGTGFLGVWGIPADIMAVVGLNLRAVGEYATTCGFDIEREPERLFAMHLLTLAGSVDPGDRAAEFAELDDLAGKLAGRHAWHDLEKQVFFTVLRRIAKMLGVRITRAKIAQILPAVGLAAAGSFNALYTRRVCRAAFFLYRERLLVEKYGADPGVF